MKKLLAILILTAIVFLPGCPKKENQPPVVQKASGLEGIVETTTGTFTWSGDDPDGTIKKYECRKDGLIWEDVALQTTYTWNDYTSGAHTFEVRAIDDKNAFSKYCCVELHLYKTDDSGGGWTIHDGRHLGRRL